MLALSARGLAPLAARAHRWPLLRTRRDTVPVVAAAAAAAANMSTTTTFYESAASERNSTLADVTVVVSNFFGGDPPADESSADSSLLLRDYASEAAWAQEAAALATGTADPARDLAARLGFRGKPGEVVFAPAKSIAGPNRAADVPTLFVGTGTTRAERVRAFAAASAKVPALLAPGAAGGFKDVFWILGRPAGQDGAEALAVVEDAALGWRLGSYSFSRYKTEQKDRPPKAPAPCLCVEAPLPSKKKAAPPDLDALGAAIDGALSLAALHCWARDLTNCPASDLGPDDLAREAAALAQVHSPRARLTLVRADELARGWPLVHAVGRASSRPPVLVDLSWQPPAAVTTKTAGASGNSAPALPLLVLCGKGVCFDTGGLSLKTSAGMRLMKKDMGGAALVLALAALIMRASLPVRLRVLVPCVENSVGGDANRLGDVLRSRLGLTVEQLNTDAEGRLILADALAEACGAECAAPFVVAGGGGGGASAADNSHNQRPDLVVDVATLTGAARVALGPELPAVFCNDDAAWRDLEAAAAAEGDPLWRLPLHAPYGRMLDSKIADLSNVPGGADATGQAGAIVAALFLERFVKGAADAAGAPAPPPWIHVDTAGWLFAGSAGPGRPEGGEPLGLRALWRLVRERYGGGGGK